MPIAAAPSESSGDGEPPDAPRSHKARRTRKIFSGVFVVLFSISLLVTVLAVWSVRQVLNTNAFAGHVEVALKSPAVQTELSDYVTKQVVKVVQPEKIAEDRLPPKAKALASPLATGFESLVNKTTNKLVANSTFQKVVLTSVTKNPPGGGQPAGGQVGRQSRDPRKCRSAEHSPAYRQNDRGPSDPDLAGQGPPRTDPYGARRRSLGAAPAAEQQVRRDAAFGFRPDRCLPDRQSSGGTTRAQKGAPPAGCPPYPDHRPLRRRSAGHYRGDCGRWGRSGSASRW